MCQMLPYGFHVLADISQQGRAGPDDWAIWDVVVAGRVESLLSIVLVNLLQEQRDNVGS